MFDFFLSPEKKIQKHQRKVTNRDVNAEDREASARWLSDQGSGKALRALLTRFDMNLTQGIHDAQEKEFLYGLLMQHGEALLKPLRVHLKKCRQIAMPLKMFEELQGEQKTIEFVYALLDNERRRIDFKPEKKTNLLIWLTTKRDDQAIENVSGFLEDFDENVRYAAAEVIIGQNDDAGREPLLVVFHNPEEDSNRVRVRVCEVFCSRRWSLDGWEGELPPPYAVRDDRVVSG